MNTLTATPPLYALDGSHGYHLILKRHNAGPIHGWIQVGTDNRTIWATLGGDSWRRVGGVVSPGDLTPEWIADHSQMILRRLNR